MHAEAHTTPYRHWIVSPCVDAALAHEAASAVPGKEWAGWVRYQRDCEKGKRTTRDLFPPLQRLADALLSAEWVGKLTEWSGVKLTTDPTWHGAGIHVVDEGGFLQVHGDYELHPHIPNAERRLNLILFLSPEWKEEWGGALLLCDPMGRTVKRIYPSFGQAAIFECGNISYHGVQVTTADAPPRISMAVYYLAEPRPSAHRMRAMFFPNRASSGVPDEVK